MSAKAIPFSRATADRVRHFHIADVTNRTVDLARYARRERWERRLEAAASCIALAMAIFLGIVALSWALPLLTGAML